MDHITISLIIFFILTTLAGIYFYLHPTSFIWDEIPGNDSNRLVIYLEERFGVNWMKNPEIIKYNDNKTIYISDVNNSVFLSNNTALIDISEGLGNLKINGKYTDFYFDIKMYNDKLNLIVPTMETLKYEILHYLVWSFLFGFLLLIDLASFIQYLHEFDKTFRKTYLFSWGKFSGTQKSVLITFLEKNFGVDLVSGPSMKPWIQKAKIEKIDDGRTIRVFTEKNSVWLRLNDEKTKVNLIIGDVKIDEFVVKTENGELYIYTKPNKKYISPLYITSLIFSLIEHEELYPRVPFFLIMVGFAIFFAAIVYNIGQTIQIMLYGFAFIAYYLGYIMIYFKRKLDGQIYYSLEKANKNFDKIDANNKNPKDINNLKRYINLAFRNINKQLSRNIELKTGDGINESTEVKDTLVKYLPYYIRFGEKEQLDSAKKHIKIMLNSVDVNDTVKWKEFTDAAMSLTIQIKKYLEDNNLNLTYQKPPKQLGWIYRNKDTVINIIGLLIVPIVIFFLGRGKT